MPLPFIGGALFVLGCALLGGAVGYGIGALIEAVLDDSAFMEINDHVREHYPKFHEAFLIFEKVRNRVRILVGIHDQEHDYDIPIIYSKEVDPSELPEHLRDSIRRMDDEEEAWEDISDELRARLDLTA